MRRVLWLLLLVLSVGHAAAQGGIVQSGPVVPGHGAMFPRNGVLMDAGSAAGGLPGVNPSEQGLTARGFGTPPYANAGSGPGGANWCDYDAPITNPTGYHYLCLSPNAAGGGLLSYGSGGVAPALPFQIEVNGQLYPFSAASGIPFVATVSALRANQSALTVVYVLGYYGVSDGGEGMFSLNLADTTSADNGGTIIVDAAGHRWYRATGGGQTQALWFGVDPTGVVDSTSKMVAAIAVGKSVQLPDVGTVHVTNTLALNNGQCLFGRERTRSLISVGSDFSSSATAVIVAGTSEPGACLRDLGITFAQPTSVTSRSSFATLAAGCTTTNGGTGCKYPPAVSVPAAGRATMDRVRISGAWDGVIATGNAGGIYFRDLEIGAIDIGLSEDGGLDFCHMSGLHFWPFGFTIGSIANVYGDGSTVAANLGRCDDWDIRGLTTYEGKVNLLSTATQGDISNLILDGDGADLSIVGGFWNISNFTTTKASDPVASVTVSGGATTISTVDMRSSAPSPLINQTGGVLKVNAGRINQNNLNYNAVAQSSGRLSLSSLEMAPGPGARTVAYVESIATEFSFVDNSFDQAGSSSGIGVQIGDDSPAIFVANNNFGGYTFLPYGPYQLGTYGPNKVAAQTFTPIIKPTTVGTWAPTYTVQQGYYWFTGQGVEFEIDVAFSTNAYTGTSGGMTIVGLPFTLSPSGASAAGNTAQITQQSKVTLDSGYTTMNVSLGASPTNVALMESGSGVAATGLAAATSFPPSTAGFVVSVHGFIPFN